MVNLEHLGNLRQLAGGAGIARSACGADKEEGQHAEPDGFRVDVRLVSSQDALALELECRV